MQLIYHLCAVDYFISIPSDQPYVPVEFDQEGFIHCTRGEEQLVVVANQYYRDDVQPILLVVIDEDSLTSTVKNESAEDGVSYPHIYGPLNREAIISVMRMPRLPNGLFQFPDRNQTRN